MTFLPIVERELRVKARQAATFHGRWVAVALALLVAMPMLMSRGPRGAPSDGKQMFLWLTMLAFAFCLVEGARQTADSLSSEKRDGTLGLLFLTDLKGYDVVLGKLAGTSLGSLYGLIAILPVLGLGIFAGGVTGGEFWRVTLVLASVLFFSLAVGLWVSARSRDEQKALGGAVLVAVLITGGLPLLEYILVGSSIVTAAKASLFSPGYACYMAFDQQYAGGPSQFWLSLACIQILSCVFLGLACRATSQAQQDESIRESIWHKLRPWPTHTTAGERADWIEEVGRRKARRQELLRASPILWLATRQTGHVRMLWLFTVLLFCTNVIPVLFWRSAPSPFLQAMLYLGLLCYLGFWFYTAAISCSFFADSRRQGAFELLLSTPVQDADIMEGQWMALKRMLAGPLVGLLVMLGVYLVSWHFGSRGSLPGISVFVSLVIQGFSLFIQWWAVCWVGVWLGLSTKKPVEATFRTFLYVILLPWLFCSGLPFFRSTTFAIPILPWFSLSCITLLFNLAFIRWAKRNLEVGVRRIILRQMSGDKRPIYYYVGSPFTGDDVSFWR